MNLYLPQIARQNDCGMVRDAQSFARIWLSILGMRGLRMHCDARLVRCAQAQAEWLASNDFDENNPHLGEGGLTANQRVRKYGYRLPQWHLDGNTVESVTHNTVEISQMTAIVTALMEHASHHDHLWGIDFWSESDYYGVGASNGFYVVLSCPAEEGV